MTKIVNGVEVELTQQDILDNEAKEAEWAIYMQEKALVQYRQDRAREYPDIGDQLDTILKEFERLRGLGQTLGQPINDLLDNVAAIKAKYPKPV